MYDNLLRNVFFFSVKLKKRMKQQAISKQRMGKISLARSRKRSNPNLANLGDVRGYWGADLVGLLP